MNVRFLYLRASSALYSKLQYTIQIKNKLWISVTPCDTLWHIMAGEIGSSIGPQSLEGNLVNRVNYLVGSIWLFANVYSISDDMTFSTIFQYPGSIFFVICGQWHRSYLFLNEFRSPCASSDFFWHDLSIPCTVFELIHFYDPVREPDLWRARQTADLSTEFDSPFSTI